MDNDGIGHMANKRLKQQLAEQGYESQRPVFRGKGRKDDLAAGIQKRQCGSAALKLGGRGKMDSQSAKNDHRPELLRMIKDSAKHLLDVVIVLKLDRSYRYDSAHDKAILRNNGVKVVSAKAVIAKDAKGILPEFLMEGYAEFYSAELSKKGIRGLYGRRKRLSIIWNTPTNKIRTAVLGLTPHEVRAMLRAFLLPLKTEYKATPQR